MFSARLPVAVLRCQEFDLQGSWWARCPLGERDRAPAGSRTIRTEVAGGVRHDKALSVSPTIHPLQRMRHFHC